MQYPDGQLLIFLKAPVPGEAKTRLIPAIGSDRAAELYQELAESLLERIGVGELCPVGCCCTPDSHHEWFGSLADRFSLTLSAQSGADLGERMFHAFQAGLQSSDAVVLIGGDCPVLTQQHLAQAFEWLYQGCDAVLGPAEDGGYVLLGLKKVDFGLFNGIAWGEKTVLSSTRERLKTLRWRWKELETLWDLDRPEDLQRYDHCSF